MSISLKLFFSFLFGKPERREGEEREESLLLRTGPQMAAMAKASI